MIVTGGKICIIFIICIAFVSNIDIAASPKTRTLIGMAVDGLLGLLETHLFL